MSISRSGPIRRWLVDSETTDVAAAIKTTLAVEAKAKGKMEPVTARIRTKKTTSNAIKSANINTEVHRPE